MLLQEIFQGTSADVPEKFVIVSKLDESKDDWPCVKRCLVAEAVYDAAR